ncbi:Mov34/MPN/PAD-1 family protein [Emcibacter sp.]|uniref:Mov34/MPN/PAD-1 family protein n=1 Tax=Emcibacter sp. TaxID=1979954 RepID=UPI003A900C2C
MTLRVPRQCLQSLRRHAEEAYPDEACGLLIGCEGEVTEVVPAKNICHTPKKAFEVDPQTLIDWQKKLRGSDQHILGSYHSHPDHPAAPSERDRARIFEEGQIWAILSVTRDGTGKINFYRAERGDFTPLEVSVF